MDNVNQPAAGGSKTGMWVALIIAVVVLGVGAYFLFGRENGTVTDNSNVVVNQNLNTVVHSVNFEQVAGRIHITGDGFTLDIPGSWYTTENTNLGNPSLLFTASNENTDGVLGLVDSDTGLVLNIVREESSLSPSEYFAANPTENGTVVSQTELLIGTHSAAKREVDSTAIGAMEGSYSVQYLFDNGDHLIEALFVGRSHNAIASNEDAIQQIVESIY